MQREPVRTTETTSISAGVSQLRRQWPVQIKLAPVNAPYFDGAKLLVAADCTAYAYAAFHDKFIKTTLLLLDARSWILLIIRRN